MTFTPIDKQQWNARIRENVLLFWGMFFILPAGQFVPGDVSFLHDALEVYFRKWPNAIPACIGCVFLLGVLETLAPRGWRRTLMTVLLVVGGISSAIGYAYNLSVCWVPQIVAVLGFCAQLAALWILWRWTSDRIHGRTLWRVGIGVYLVCVIHALLCTLIPAEQMPKIIHALCYGVFDAQAALWCRFGLGVVMLFAFYCSSLKKAIFPEEASN